MRYDTDKIQALGFQGSHGPELLEGKKISYKNCTDPKRMHECLILTILSWHIYIFFNQNALHFHSLSHINTPQT